MYIVKIEGVLEQILEGRHNLKQQDQSISIYRYICTSCTKVARYVKRAVISTKNLVNLNYLKQHDISERLVNTALEKLENLDLNSTDSVVNDHLISSINSATEETLPMREKNTIHDMMISY